MELGTKNYTTRKTRRYHLYYYITRKEDENKRERGEVRNKANKGKNK
jgi:hypothetical protein